MKYRTVFLTILLTIGISLQSCYDCNCGVYKPFFDIEGIYLNHSTNSENNNGRISFKDYKALVLSFDLRYYTKTVPFFHGFSLMNEAHACSCPEPGKDGSKDEKIIDIVVITKNKYNDSLLANDTINDIILVEDFSQNANAPLISLAEYINKNESLVLEPSINLYLATAPKEEVNFQVELILKLSTNETYNYTSESIILY